MDAAKLSRARQDATLDVSPISLREGQIALAAGEYRAELEDAFGVFYRGPGRSFRVLEETYPGGIYITKPPAPLKYRLYYYKDKASAAAVDSTATAAGIVQTAAPTASPVAAGVGAAAGTGIVSYMVHMNDGKLMLLQPIEGVNYPQLVRARNH